MIALNVTLLLDVESEDEAFDAMNEILREQQRSFSSSSCLIDYAVNGDPVDAGPLPRDYEEGDYFGTSNTGASHGVYAYPGGPESVVDVPANQDQAIAAATTAKSTAGRRGKFSTMRPLSEIMAERAPIDQPEQIAQRLSERQIEALEKLAERPNDYLAASVLKVSGMTLMSLNDFERTIGLLCRAFAQRESLLHALGSQVAYVVVSICAETISS